MDIQRYLLIAASAALAIMLLSEWTTFTADNGHVEDRVRLAETRSPASLSTSVLPTPPNTPSTTAPDELPTVDITDRKDATTLEDQRSVSLITVTTDTLQVVIDRVGGDIVEAALPRFPDNLDNPDLPFVILEANNTRTYVAQSGFVGRDGFDVPERAIYSSDKDTYIPRNDEAVAVVLTAIDVEPRISVTKTFTFTPGSYVIDVSYAIENNSARRWEAVPFAQLKRDSSLPPAADTSGFGMQPFLGAATTTPEDRFKKFSFDDIADEPWKLAQSGG